MYSFCFRASPVVIRYLFFLPVLVAFMATSCQGPDSSSGEGASDELGAELLKVPRIGVAFSKEEINKALQFTWSDLHVLSEKAIKIPDGKKDSVAVLGLAFKLNAYRDTLVDVFAVYPSDTTLKGIEVEKIGREIVIII